MPDQTAPTKRPLINHTDLPYAEQKEAEVAHDLIRNALRLSNDAGVHPTMMLNVLLDVAARAVATCPDAAHRAEMVAAVKENFGLMVEEILQDRKPR